MNNKSSQSGFTLIEILLVIVMLSAMAAMTISAILGQKDKARYASILYTAKQIASITENVYVSQGGVYSVDVGSNTMPSGFSKFMKVWPKPPCTGWEYDYENWGPNTTIRISVRRANPNTAIVYYCVYTTGNCNSGNGTDINSWASKKITCKE